MHVIDARSFIEKLESLGIELFAGVPDSLLKEFCSALLSEREQSNIICANEGNAVALVSGYHLASGRFGCVYMQNSGEGNAINPLASLADRDVYSIPLFMVVGWRGEPGVADEPQHVKQGKITCSLLECMDIPYEVLGDTWERQLERLGARMKEESRPVACVVTKGTFANYKVRQAPDVQAEALLREEALDVLLNTIGEHDLIVSTTGKTSRELFELREQKGMDHAHDFLCVGSMGHSSSIALGVALACDRRLWCVDGDGALLMHAGALPVIAQHAPDNFRYIVNNNAAHESVGSQPTAAKYLDLAEFLRASGFDHVFSARTQEELSDVLKQMCKIPKSALVLYTRTGSRDDLGRPTTTPLENKQAFMDEIASSANGKILPSKNSVPKDCCS